MYTTSIKWGDQGNARFTWRDILIRCPSLFTAWVKPARNVAGSLGERTVDMLPMKAVRLLLGALLAADATTFAPAALANKIALIMAPFVPSETLTVAGLTLATFNGSTPISGALGAQQTGVDPVTGDQILTVKDPAGGYRWITGSTASLPQTIYGYALLDSTLATLLAVATFPTPYVLQDVGQEINIGSAVVHFVQQPMS